MEKCSINFNGTQSKGKKHAFPYHFFQTKLMVCPKSVIDVPENCEDLQGNTQQGSKNTFVY